MEVCMKELLFRNKKAFTRYLIGCTILITEFVLTNYAIARLVGVVQTKDLGGLSRGLLLGLVSYIYAALVFILSRHLRIGFMRDTTLLIRMEAFEKIMTKTMRSFNKKLRTEYISNLVNDINTFEGKYFHALLNLIFGFTIYSVSILILFYLDVTLALAMVAVSLFVFGVSRSFQKKTIRMQEEVQRSNEKYTVNIANTFSGLEILKLNRLEDRFLLQSMKETDRLERRKAGYNVFTFWQQRFSGFLGTIISILIIYYVIRKAGTAYDLTRLMFTVSMASSTIWPITEIMPLFNVLKSNANIIERILAPDEDGQKEEEVQDYVFEDRIEIRDLSFAYDERPVLSRASLTLEKGKKYLLKGASGAGKSTFINLLSKVYDNYEGEIRVDGVDLRTIREESFNASASFIYQDVFLFEDTIRNNIELYRSYPVEDLEKAIAGSGLTSLLAKRPQGLEEAIEENGRNLSGGERQRIAIARAIIRNPVILFADEVTSSLDESLGRLVEDTILSLDTTVIAISHRFYRGVTEKYDAVIEIANGTLQLLTMEEYLRGEGHE